MPDGAYYLKIVASDAPSNAPDQALSTQRESERFEIDNTPPVVEGLQASTFVVQRSAAASSGVLVKFTARDSATSVERAQYSVDGGDWILASPVNKISDAPEEHYEISMTGLAAGEHTIAVRAFDRFENIGAAKITFTIPR
jgi:hypothetical protein